MSVHSLSVKGLVVESLLVRNFFSRETTEVNWGDQTCIKRIIPIDPLALAKIIVFVIYDRLLVVLPGLLTHSRDDVLANTLLGYLGSDFCIQVFRIGRTDLLLLEIFTMILMILVL